jgi:hypothetical protein
LSLQSFNDSLRQAQNSLRTLSEETGGYAAVNRNDFTGAFARVVKDNSAYYVLGYYPKNDRRDGGFRRIEVKMKKPGLEVHARRGYTAPRGKAPEKSKVPAGDQTSPQVREALDSPVPMSGMRLHAFAAAFKGAAPNTDVSVTIEAEGGSFGFQDKDGKFLSDLEVSTIAVDYQGKIRGGDRSFVNFALKPENQPKFVATGVRVGSRLHVPPGRYQLRVAARESATGRLGTVNYDIDVPDFTKDPLAMSGIAIASAFESRIATVKADEELKAVLPAPPTAMREFPRGDELALFAEVYDNDLKAPHTVDITTIVVSEDDRTVFSTNEERQSSELAGKPGGFGHSVRISTKEFAPGVYVLTVQAKSRNGKTPPSVSRSVQFRIR